MFRISSLCSLPRVTTQGLFIRLCPVRALSESTFFFESFLAFFDEINYPVLSTPKFAYLIFLLYLHPVFNLIRTTVERQSNDGQATVKADVKLTSPRQQAHIFQRFFAFYLFSFDFLLKYLLTSFFFSNFAADK